MPDDDANHNLLRRVAAGLLAASGRGRTVRRIGPFESIVAPSSDAYLMSLAVPVAMLEDWAPAIAQLDAYFTGCQRTLRLEFFEELVPTLAPALEAAGMTRQMTAPVLACTPESFRPATAPPEAGVTAGLDEGVRTTITALGPRDAAAIDAFLALQADAFAMPLSTAYAWRDTLTAGLSDDTILAMVAMVDDAPAAGATLLIGGDVAELAGVGTDARFRRRGLAAAVCSHLVARYFAHGGSLCWLSSGPEALALYENLGFRTIGTQINIGRKQG